MEKVPKSIEKRIQLLSSSRLQKHNDFKWYDVEKRRTRHHRQTPLSRRWDDIRNPESYQTSHSEKNSSCFAFEQKKKHVSSLSVKSENEVLSSWREFDSSQAQITKSTEKKTPSQVFTGIPLKILSSSKFLTPCTSSLKKKKKPFQFVHLPIHNLLWRQGELLTRIPLPSSSTLVQESASIHEGQYPKDD